MRVGGWERGRWGRVSGYWMGRGMAKLWVKVMACEGALRSILLGVST